MTTHVEKWKNGLTYSVERDSHGRFVKGSKRTTINVFLSPSYGTKRKPEPMFYRSSWNIKGIPVHSTPQNPIYYGFTIWGFSEDKMTLDRNRGYLKGILMNSMKKYLQSIQYVNEVITEANYEEPFQVNYNVTLSNRYVLKVEKNGREIDTETGYLR